MQINAKKNRGFKWIRIHELCVSPAVVSQLSYEDQLLSGILRQEDPEHPLGMMRNPKICLTAKKKCKFWNSLFSFKIRCNANWFFFVSADSFWISYRKSAILRLHVTLCRWCRIALWDPFGDTIPFLVIVTLCGKLGPNSSPKILPLYSSSLMGNLKEVRWKKDHLSEENIS